MYFWNKTVHRSIDDSGSCRYRRYVNEVNRFNELQSWELRVVKSKDQMTQRYCCMSCIFFLCIKISSSTEVEDNRFLKNTFLKILILKVLCWYDYSVTWNCYWTLNWTLYRVSRVFRDKLGGIYGAKVRKKMLHKVWQ